MNHNTVLSDNWNLLRLISRRYLQSLALCRFILLIAVIVMCSSMSEIFGIAEEYFICRWRSHWKVWRRKLKSFTETSGLVYWRMKLLLLAI